MLEVAMLGFAAWSAGPLLVAGSVPVLNYFGERGIELDLLLTVASLACWVLQFVAAFWYGLKRQRHLVFGYVLFGWAVGIICSSAVTQLVLPTAKNARHGDKAHTTLLAYAMAWGVLVLLLSLLAILPTLSAMYGQKRRMRSSSTS